MRANQAEWTAFADAGQSDAVMPVPLGEGVAAPASAELACAEAATRSAKSGAVVAIVPEMLGE